MDSILNIGCVVYTKTTQGIDAEWRYRQNDQIEKGTGVGIDVSNNVNERFEGQYDITYVGEQGQKSPTLRLDISQKEGVFYLRWLLDNRTTDIGVGMLVDGKLIAGYAEAPESPPTH